jgi:hypothetical protein
MKKFVTGVLVLAVAAGSGFAQAVNICGTVTDQNGQPLTNTLVRLAQTTYDAGYWPSPYIVKTDNTGYYHLGSGTCAVNVINESKMARGDALSQPKYLGGRVLFSLPQDNGQVRMSVYELAGRFVRDVMNSRLSKGNYAVSIDTRGISSQFYLLRVSINGATPVIKLQPLSRVSAGTIAQNALVFQAHLEKLTAVAVTAAVDTLHATEPGYTLGVTPISALTGTCNFTLTKNNTWNGDTAAFWGNTSTYPTNASYVILNRTNGAFPDSKIFWSIQQGGVKTSIAVQPTVPIPAGNGRFYIWVAPTDSGNRYFDFLELNYNGTWYGNTTRVDGWRLPITFRVHSSTGQDNALGDAYHMFYQSRQSKFDEYNNEVPKEFTHLDRVNFANIYAPHMTAVNYFNTGGVYVNYFDKYEDSVIVHNPGAPAKTTAWNIFACAGTGTMGASPQYSAAVNRHCGTISPQTAWNIDTNYYKTGPCNYFSYWCHRRSLKNMCYGFPYDDVGGHAAYLAQSNIQWLAIAIGW